MLARSDQPSRIVTKLSLESLLEIAGDVVFRTDRDGKITYVSRRTLGLLADNDTVLGSELARYAPPEDLTLLHTGFQEATASGVTHRIDIRLNTQQGMVWHEMQITLCDTDNGNTEFLVIARNAAQLHATEERLNFIATHDELTGLPNRSLLADRLTMAIAQAKRTGVGFSVLALNLDGFKKVNEALGHAVGDALLKMASARLSDSVRDVDTFSRVSGDEFVAILPGAVDLDEIQFVARRMIAATQLPFEIDGHVLHLSTSVGAVTYPQHGDSDIKLLAHADAALCRAKDTGKSRCIIYDTSKFTLPQHDVSLEAAMFDAVRNGEFRLFYQPIIDTSKRQVVGFEALMRWMHPDLGPVSPAQFIPMAEANGLISLLGAWALKSACMQIKQFEQAAGHSLYVSVNVSPRQFRNDMFVKIMDDAMKLSGIDGSHLLLEITEGVLMSDPEHAVSLLNAIAKRNVRIAIDDFGTGYSSLAYLKQFPIAVLKIDRAFIKDLPESVKDAAICNVVLSLANHLNLKTIAEGVENDQQLGFLMKQGCSMIQGFFTGRPLPPSDILAALKNGMLPNVNLAENVKMA